MLSDITIDTNVFAHCYNPIEPRCAAALALVVAVKDGRQLLCVDDGFDIVESRNRSMIGSEYKQHLRAGSPGLSLIAFLASKGRIRVLPKRPPQDIKQAIEQAVWDTYDRVFASVAWQSSDRILASHDFLHFPDAVRSQLKLEIDLAIVDAASCCAMCA